MTFIVSQRTASVRFADRILVLDDGECIGQGTHEELLDTCQVYREIHEAQQETPADIKELESSRKASGLPKGGER